MRARREETVEIRREGDTLILHEPPVRPASGFYLREMRPLLFPALILCAATVFMVFRMMKQPENLLSWTVLLPCAGFVYLIHLFVCLGRRHLDRLTNAETTLTLTPETLRIATEEQDITLLWSRVGPIVLDRESEEGIVYDFIRFEYLDAEHYEFHVNTSAEGERVYRAMTAYIKEHQLPVRPGKALFNTSDS